MSDRIVDIGSIEHQKENIVPLKQGRDPKVLAKVFAETPEEDLALAEKAFEERVARADETEDALGVHCDYISWYQQHKPQGHVKFMSIVERAVRQYRKDERYKQDLRYLNLWLIVIRHTKEPIEVFKYLAINGIASLLAPYYIEYAKHMESIRKYDEVEEIFALGISKKAQPLVRLRTKYQEFLERRANLVEQQQAIPEPNPNALRVLQGSSATISSSSSGVTGPKISVYTDNSSAFTSNVLPNAGEEWDDLGTFEARRRENVHVSAMAGTRVPQKSKPEVHDGVFQVYRDQQETAGTRKERFMCDLTLVYAEEEEFSFEEIRFRQGKFSMRPLVKEDVLVYEEYSYALPETDSPKKIQKRDPARKPLAVKSLPPEEPVEEPKKIVKLPNSLRIDNEDLPVCSSLKNVPSPTINTKEALADVFEMFNAPLSCEKVEEDVTISSKVYKQEFSSFTVGSFDDDLGSPKPHVTQTPFRTYSVDVKPNSLDTQSNTNSNKSRPLNRFHNINIMTPIAEMSFEDRSVAGLSTIGSGRIRNMDDTMYTFATIGGDNTISSLPRRSSSTLAMINEEDVGPLGYEEQESIPSDHDEEEELEKEPLCDTLVPCNPRSPSIFNKIILRALPYLVSHPTLVDCRTQICDFKPKNSKDFLNEDFELEKFGKFSFVSKLGEGGFAKIYLVMSDDLDAFDDVIDDGRDRVPPLSALKIEESKYPWEFYVLQQIRDRVDDRTRESIIKAYSCHVYKDTVCTRLQYFDHGTLVDCVNHAVKDGYGVSVGVSGSSANSGVDELLAMFWAIELLRTVEAVHSAGIIHGDLKADNVLVRLGESDEWSSQYEPNGSKGWSQRGLALLDWGVSIDLSVFGSGQMFVNDKAQDASTECFEIRNGLPWRYQGDWYGVAGIIHVLLFGQYMQVIERPQFPTNEKKMPFDISNLDFSASVPHVSLKNSFKRYWQVEIWDRLFEVLLNSGAYSAASGYDNIQRDSRLSDPPASEDYLDEFKPAILIRSLRHEMEDWLVANCSRAGKSLKSLLRRVEVAVLERK